MIRIGKLMVCTFIRRILVLVERKKLAKEYSLPEDDLSWEQVDPDLKKWICAACAVNRQVFHMDVHELGGFVPGSRLGKFVIRDMMMLAWDIYSRRDLIETIQDMIDDKLAWQLLRVLQLAGSGYVAGYLTLRESLNVSIAAGQRLQKVTRSWEGLANAYARDYAHYMDCESGGEDRRKAFQTLKRAKDTPYTVPFDMVLVKSW